jgi:hypothetical protein
MTTAVEQGAHAPPSRSRLRRTLLVLVPVLIVGWQLTLLEHPERLHTEYRDRATGMCYPDWARFFYFYYYLDAFPLDLKLPRYTPSRYSPSVARALVSQYGEHLVMAHEGPCAVGLVGEYLRIALFLPAAWIQGTPKAPTNRPVKVLLFLGGLLGLLVAFERVGAPALGLALVVLLGSNPFQLFQTYVSSNIFSFTITAAVITLALHVRFLRDAARPRPSDLLIALATGAFLATMREIRTEAAVSLLAVVPTYLSARGFSWTRRALLTATVLTAFATTSMLWTRHFDGAFERATQLARTGGGAPYPGHRRSHHPIWHSIWCGLGDFGWDRGYRWGDQVAYGYATPILNAEYGYDLVFEGDFFYENTYEGGVYRIKPENLPEYTEVVRDKVLEDVLGSPGWYASILASRLVRVFTKTTPLQLHAFFVTIPIPWSGWLALPLLGWLVWRREFFLAKVLAFTAPMSLVPLFIHSGDGTTYYALFPTVSAAIVASQLVALLARYPRNRRRSAGVA